MKEEFRKLYLLNAVNLPNKVRFGNNESVIGREDYLGDPNKVVPVADPSVSSEAMQLQKALTIKQMAASTPGYNQTEVEKMVLKAMKVENMDTLYPGPGAEGATVVPDPKMELEKLKLQGVQMEIEAQKVMIAAKLVEEHHLNEAKINELMAKAQLEFNQAGETQTNVQIQALNAMIGAMKHRNDHVLAQAELLLRAKEIDQAAKETTSVSK
jgi:hypothetical protein